MILNKIYHTLVGYKSRPDYWSCSEVAHQMQEVHGIPKKPEAATSEGWAEWTAAAKKASPVGYWITEEGLGYLQDIAYFIPDVYSNIRYKLKNIFISKSHVIPTGLSLGEFHGCDSRIEHGLFWLLVDFVEKEKAHMLRWCHDDESELPTDKREAGLAYLDWEISLGDESPIQSLGAKEIKEIYLWIKDVYPNRPDPYDVSGWSDYCDSKENMFGVEKDEAERLHVREMLDTCHKLEQQYRDEVTEMLNRIITVREQMWT